MIRLLLPLFTGFVVWGFTSWAQTSEPSGQNTSLITCTNNHTSYKVEFVLSTDKISMEKAQQYHRTYANGPWEVSGHLRCRQPTVEKNVLGICSEIYGPDAGHAIYLLYSESKKKYTTYDLVSGPDGKTTRDADFTCVTEK